MDCEQIIYSIEINKLTSIILNGNAKQTLTPTHPHTIELIFIHQRE